MKPLERLREILFEHGVPSDLNQEETELTTFIATGVLGCRLATCDLNGILLCSILIPITVPDYSRDVVAAAITRYESS